MIVKLAKRALSIVIALILTLSFAMPSFAINYSVIDTFDSDSTEYLFTQSEKKIIKDSLDNPVLVGVIVSSAPACYIDEATGEFVGMTIDILDAVQENTGLNFKYETINLKTGVPVVQLKAGNFDIVAGILKTQNFIDDKEIILSDAVIYDSLVVVGRRGEDFTCNAKNKTIVTQGRFQVGEEYVAAMFPEHNVLLKDNVVECLNAVVSNEADALVFVRTSLSHYLQNPHYENLEILPAFSVDVDTCMAALADTNSELMDIVNKGLKMISESERNSIMLNYTIKHPYEMSLSDIIYKYRAPLFIIALLFIAVIVTLIMLGAYRRRSKRKLQEAYKQEMEATERTKDALALAEKASAAKGGFMSRMSHEIRTPLNAIIGYNTIAKNEMSSAKNDADRKQADMKVMDCLTKSELASKHLLTIINDVLDMSAIESGKINVAHERFDFKNMITALTAIFYSQAKAKDVRFDVAFDNLTEEWFVGDQMRVNQILTNLLSNAIKFTPAGGYVSLVIRRQPETENNTVHIRFEVTDTGIGMKKEYIDHIFTPFEQADSTISRRYGGSGLGLAITKNLVDLMNGTIGIESELGKGSKFTVDLAFERTEQPKNAKAYDFSGVKALVVDDDESARDYVRLLFSRCGAACDTASSGIEAIRMYKDAIADKSKYTLCIVDWRMPEMNGIETIEKIRELSGAELPIIIISAYDFSDISNKAKSVGVSAFISKPLFQSTLFDLLANIGGQKSPVAIKKSAAFNFSGETVMLAEDNAMNMEVARRLLASVNLNVDCVANGREAVDKFIHAPAHTYKAILMDVQMPEMDGHEATRVIRSSSHPEAKIIPIIAMTADAFAENVAESMAAGMNDHVAKPIDMRTLFDTLAKYIDNAAT